MFGSVGMPELIILLVILGIVVFVVRGAARSLESGMWQGGGVLGLILGVVFGLLTRPSLPLVGQLPITTVLTRGETLSGMDQLLKSAAEESFNHVALFTVGGAVAGVAVGAYMRRRTTGSTAESQVPPVQQSPTSQPQQAVQSPPQEGTFCTGCGTKFASNAAFCSNCGTKR